MNDNEIWKDIDGYDGAYQISNYGKVKSVERKVYNPAVLGDNDYRTVPELIRKHNIMKGYHCITLLKDGTKKSCRVAKLVMQAFGTPQPSDKHQISYIDGNKDNLFIDNLKWVLPSESIKLAIADGRIKPHSEERKRKISERFRELWKNPEYRASESERMRKRWSDKECRERTLESMREAGRKRREKNAEIRASRLPKEVYHVPDEEGEIWADIDGFEGQYQVSNHGRIKSCDRILPHKTHGTWHIKERLLKQVTTPYGYMSASFHLGEGKMQTVRVHRMVAIAFIPNPMNLPQVNHIDGNKQNNHVSNLEWVTEHENTDHAWSHGLCDNIVKCKQVPVINLDTGERFESIASAERSFGKITGAIGHVLKGKAKHAYGYRWAYVDKE